MLVSSIKVVESLGNLNSFGNSVDDLDSINKLFSIGNSVDN